MPKVTEAKPEEAVLPEDRFAQELQVPKKTVHYRLSKVAEHCAYIRKDGINQFHKYSYATAAQIFEKVGEALQLNGLISIPQFSIVANETRTTAKGTTETLITVQCALTLFHDQFSPLEPNGLGSLTTHAYGSGMDLGDKAIMKAQTAALKYAWMMLLNISTGDDPEADDSVDSRTEGISKAAKQRAEAAPKVAPEPPQEPLDTLEQVYPDSESPSIFEKRGPSEVEKLKVALESYRKGQSDLEQTHCDCGSEIISRETKVTGKKYRTCEASHNAFIAKNKLDGKHYWKYM